VSQQNPILPPFTGPTYTTLTAQPNWQGRLVLTPKRLRETVLYPMDFISLLAFADTIDQIAVEMAVDSGYDPAADNMISGPAMLNGSVVMQYITGGVLGVIYRLTYWVVTASDQILQLTGYLPVVPDVSSSPPEVPQLRWVNAFGQTVEWQNDNGSTVAWQNAQMMREGNG